MDDKYRMILRLFPYLKNKALAAKLKIDDDSLHYISIREFAKKISDIITFHLKGIGIDPYNAIITDATAGVGGNTLSFAKYFRYIYAIEIDKIRADYLKNNIQVYELNNIQVINDDCLNILPRLTDHNVIFIDPPWGGKSYKDHNNLKLEISDISIETVCNQLINKNKMSHVPDIIILKLPKNYDIVHFYGTLNEKTIYFYDLNKMIILVVIVSKSLSNIK